jgi:hypothetical protein
MDDALIQEIARIRVEIGGVFNSSGFEDEGLSICQYRGPFGTLIGLQEIRCS